MKILLLLLTLLAASSVAQPTTEVVKVFDLEDLISLNAMLADGWVVKHQSVSLRRRGPTGDIAYGTPAVIVTLTPPPPEVLAKAQARRQEEFAKRRAEYLKGLDQPVEKK